jgi:hypothetical protein
MIVGREEIRIAGIRAKRQATAAKEKNASGVSASL